MLLIMDESLPESLRDVVRAYICDEFEPPIVFAGDVLLHLMNPMKALQNICSVTAGRALLVNVFNPVLPGKLISHESGAVDCTWWMMSLAGSSR